MNRRELEDRVRMIDRLVKLGFSREEVAALRRISMTLRRWFELECGTENAYGTSIAVEYGFMDGGLFKSCSNREECKELGSTCKSFIRASWMDSTGYHVEHSPTPDREAGARKRLATIMSQHKNCLAYVQTDPRGCALRIIKASEYKKWEKDKPADKPWMSELNYCCYSSIGVAVY